MLLKKYIKKNLFCTSIILQQAFIGKTEKLISSDDNVVNHMNPYNFPGVIEPVGDFEVLLAWRGVSTRVIMDQGEGCRGFSNSWDHDLSWVNNTGI